MSIDLDQLPIPDWGLHCPKCNYPLVGLPSHRCPECGLGFRMRDVIQSWDRLRDPWYTGAELPLPEWGLQCTKCGASLTGISTYECESCGAKVRSPLESAPQRDWFTVSESFRGGLAVSFCESLMQAHDIPHRRDIPPVYIHQIRSEAELLAQREFYFDVLHILAKEKRLMAEGRQLAEGPPMKCPQCHAESPGNFTQCWNCGQVL